MSNPFFIVFDTETTGLEPGSRPVEIAALKVDSVLGDIIDQFCILVNPGMPIPPDMPQFHKIDGAQVIGAPTRKEACAKFLEFIQGAEFVMAHNAIYDVGILSWAIGSVGLELPIIGVACTLEMAKKLKVTPNNKLQTLVAHYGISPKGEAHRALADCHSVLGYYQVAKWVNSPVVKPWVAPHDYCDLTRYGKEYEPIAAAVEKGEKISFSYQDKEGNKTEREIIPYGWADIKGRLQIHGLCLMRNERRCFNADQMVMK
jgi:DNA polymerase-3 subunit epsilon